MSSDVKRLLVIGSFTLILVYLCHDWAQARGLATQHDPLYDIMHNNLPDWSKHSYIRDFFLIVPLIIIGLHRKPPGGVNLLTKFFSYYIVIILIRCLTVSVTSIPPVKVESNNVQKAVTGLSLIKGSGHDLMFSGHTAFMVLCALIMIDHNVLPISNLAVYLLLGGYMLLILLCRAHYTVDIIISFLLTYFIYTTKLHI